MDIPVDLNPEGVNIVEKEFGACPVYELILMANRGIPEKCLSKVFSLASCDVL